MIDLIKRLEAATEGSPELDEQICDAVLVPAKPVRLYGRPEFDIPTWRHPGGLIRTAPRFTTSFDAALTLMPKRGWFSEIHWSDGFAAAYVGPTPDRRFKGISETMPLALCIAALKARNYGSEV